MLPSVHEDDENDVLGARPMLRRQRFETLGDTIRLPAIIAASLIVEFDNRKLVRRAGHETVKRLMLRVRHDPCRRPHLDRRKAFEAVIGLRHRHRVPHLRLAVVR